MATTKLKLIEAKAIYDALQELVKGQPAVADAKVFLPFRLKAARWKVVKNIAALEPLVQLINTTRDNLIIEISGGGNKIEETDTEKITQFRAELGKVINQDVEVDISKISEQELNLDENEIPFSILAVIYGVLNRPAKIDSPLFEKGDPDPKE